MSFPERWMPRKLANGEWLRTGFGSACLVVANLLGEWRVGLLPDGAPVDLPESGTTDNLPEGITWERWAHGPDDARIQIRPAFPDMPVIARPHHVLHLPPKSQATFFVGIPAWLEVVAECQGEMLSVFFTPAQRLSKTWHGTPIAGRLAYALRTFARRTFEPVEWPAHDIVCGIEIVNGGSEVLSFERLFLETDHLAVFTKDGRLWSNAARIRAAQDQSNLSNITFAPRPSTPYDDATEVTPPRQGKTRRSTIHSAFAKVLGHFNPLDDP